MTPPILLLLCLLAMALALCWWERLSSDVAGLRMLLALFSAVILGMFGSETARSDETPKAGERSSTQRLEWVRPSEDGTQFVGTKTERRIALWGVNYDHDSTGRLIEDYWDKEWVVVAGDFREIKALGANIVRVHLQLAKFMETAERENEANLSRLAKLVRLAEECGLYLDVTGLGCYHKSDVPPWYDVLGEDARWSVQERFWKAVAMVCRDSPAVFCYDLMNEPVVSNGNGKMDWLPGEPLGGKQFVQRITIDMRGRDAREIARDWIRRLTSAIRSMDDRHMITVGVIPWPLYFKGAKPLFYAPDVSDPLDFVSVHFYPKKGDLDAALDALAVYKIGKPLVIEEIFPLHCSVEEAGVFIERSKRHAVGWISFYWGKTIEENQQAGDLSGALVAAWLHYFRSHSPVHEIPSGETPLHENIPRFTPPGKN